MQDFELIFYDKADGTEPAKDFVLNLDIKMRAKMLRAMTLLEANGNALGEPYSKPLGDGIFELRAEVGTDISFHGRTKDSVDKWIYQENTENAQT